MAGLCWMAVVLAFSLSVGNTEAMDPKMVEAILKYILAPDKFFIANNQFSLAVNIPKIQNLKELQDIFKADIATTVISRVKNGQVYTSNNMVEAIPLDGFTNDGKPYTEHAEARVLDYIKPLADSSEGKSLVFYSYLSPCGTKCTNPNHPYNILKKINNIHNDRWVDSAFVFSKVFDGYTDQNGIFIPIPKDELKNTLINLGATKFGSDNIFRCLPGNRQCIKCFDNNGIFLDDCLKN